ncbi:MAG TPA: hypothetical protein VIY86_02240, partial [Pirellulaceae bacterium]
MIVILVVAVYFAFFFVVSIRRPGSVLGAVISFYAIEQWSQANSSFFVYHPTIINYALGALIVWALAFTWVKHGNPLRRISIISWATYVLLGLAYISYLWSNDPVTTRFVFGAYLHYLITYTVLLPLVFTDRRDIRDGAVAALAVGVPILAMVYFGTVVGFRLVEFQDVVFDRWGKAHAGGNPLAIGSFGGSVIIVAMALRFRGLSQYLQFARWAVLPLGLLVVFRSESRGQLAATILCVVAVYMLNFGRQKFRQIVGLGFAVIMIYLVISLTLPNVVYVERWSLKDQLNEFQDTRLQY